MKVESLKIKEGINTEDTENQQHRGHRALRSRKLDARVESRKSKEKEGINTEDTEELAAQRARRNADGIEIQSSKSRQGVEKRGRKRNGGESFVNRIVL